VVLSGRLLCLRGWDEVKTALCIGAAVDRRHALGCYEQRSLTGAPSSRARHGSATRAACGKPVLGSSCALYSLQ
jgi:hypothetical protein